MATLVLVPAGRGLAVVGRAFRLDSLPSGQQSKNAGAPLAKVWMVDQQEGAETWSNGLRIERKFEVANTPRSYSTYSLNVDDSRPGPAITQPAGIVFHTTESHQAEFEEKNTPQLQRLGEGLLRYVRDEKSYHYVIDRFGRVWRVVREADAANHAGHSVWADGNQAWVNLNHSFVGIALEAQSQTERGGTSANAAQIHALRMLTEMVRARYNIPAFRCVTHAQVSVNPSNRQAAYHYDWAANFPYAAVGLPENYRLPLPSLWAFGFTYDPSLVTLSGVSYWHGLLLGEEQLRQHASAHGLAAAEYRELLARRYRQILTVLKSQRTEASQTASKESQG